MSKKIVDLTPYKAKKFFLKSTSYCNFDLPPYFDFKNLLEVLENKVGSSNYKKYLDDFIDPTNGKTIKMNPKQIEDVNYKIFANKNGTYDWRQLELIHPLLYISLINLLTQKTNWKTITERFKEFHNQNYIECASIPVVSTTKLPDKAKQIKEWWTSVEQRSLELSLKYAYLFQSDISNCYSEIYTHSVSWAIHEKSIAKNNIRDKSLFGNQIDEHLMAMSFGQTNGIPQGSTLMDFIAEMVLGYVDEILTKKINASLIDVDDFHILRYRDDYRIFTNSPEIGHKIVKFLTESLIELGLKLNSTKTTYSDTVLLDSIKEDKNMWVTKYNQDYVDDKEYAKFIQLIRNFSHEFPNSGTLVTELLNFYKTVEDLTKIKGNNRVMIAYLVDIALRNPRAYPICAAVISKLLSLINNNNIEIEIICDIQKKFEKIPNTGFLDIWMQRITVKEYPTQFQFTEPLCMIVDGKQIELWDSTWVKKPLSDLIKNTPIVLAEKIEDINPVVKSEEINLFMY